MQSSTSFLFVFLVLYLLSAFAHPGEGEDYLKVHKLPATSPYEDVLSFAYYYQKCPEAEAIINQKGCDGSILLNHEGSERKADVSKTLRGFEVIDDIKAEIEKKCPKIVSCTDILTAAARDATVSVGGPYWMVPYGRKDGLVSFAKEAQLVPMGHEDITSLVEFYQSKGAHTIGRASCGSIQDRLFNYSGTGKPDPSLDAQYLNYLKRKCRWSSDYVDLDATTPKTFDAEYYSNLPKKMGLLSTDEKLYSDPRTAPLVSALAYQPSLFFYQFGVSMAKLGNVQCLLGNEGEIRYDGSILLNHEGSERKADVSKTLRGFKVINDIKAEIEKKCPKTVSCVDILTAAARDATVSVGGPYWMVPYGRKDGLVSLAKEAQLFNYCGTGKPDPSLNAQYLNYLKRKCRWSLDYMDLDATTLRTFDSEYYSNLPKKMRLLSTDEKLYTDPRTAPLVNALGDQPSFFFYQFGVSMAKLGNVQCLLGHEERINNDAKLTRYVIS
ncbi:peroxidase 7 [Quercus suber]|uniref:peroxidase n=1 Tax=Quercus suber TaxID=58331 RepID=A0AAW0IF32_QUESU